MPSSANFSDRAAAAIDRLHRLLQAWLRGEGDRDPQLVLSHFDPGYRMVGAVGTVTDYAMLAAGLPAMRGSRPTLVMEIGDVAVSHIDGSTALVTYRETQHQDSGTTERWAAAILLDRPGQQDPAWLHLQETFCAQAGR